MDKGVQFRMNGYETLVVVGLQNLEKIINNIDVIVLNTKSRLLSLKKQMKSLRNL